MFFHMLTLPKIILSYYYTHIFISYQQREVNTQSDYSCHLVVKLVRTPCRKTPHASF